MELTFLILDSVMNRSINTKIDMRIYQVGLHLESSSIRPDAGSPVFERASCILVTGPLEVGFHESTALQGIMSATVARSRIVGSCDGVVQGLRIVRILRLEAVRAVHVPISTIVAAYQSIVAGSLGNFRRENTRNAEGSEIRNTYDGPRQTSKDRFLSMAPPVESQLGKLPGSAPR